MKPSNQRNYRPKHRSKELKVEWCSVPKMKEEPKQEPVTLPLQAHSWYEFCIYRQAEYESRGEKTAAMMYWVMRFWVDDRVCWTPDPTTEEGLKEVQDYISFKLDTVPWMFD